MPEAEISSTGTVLVEGHHVGELQGFRFTADQSAGGEDAKAVRTAAQKALAAEFEARAERFGACANGDIALGSDGTLRWIGAPIGTLVSGEDPLKPRLVLLADEQLTGPARDKVAARAERFVNFQIESLLKPLVDLKNAEQITGIGRGIAFQLVEQFGLINRRDIADEMKSLDQEGRAALRRLGVRFGAYHIFVPALIKPAPAGLVTLLWALKNDGKDKPGFGDVVHALASGRTSVVIDPAFDKSFYKLAGYRNLGRRAVRVDILERLADLIRPATNWKPGLGQRPDGAYDGQSFMVTPPMMSILGANADDMEEILKGLGYRAEPKPPAEVKARLEAQDNAAREAAAAKLAAEEAARAEKTKAAEAAVTDAATDAEASAEGLEPTVEAPVENAAEPIAEAAAETVAEEAEEQAQATQEAAADTAADVHAEPAAAAAHGVEAEAEALAPTEPSSEAAPGVEAVSGAISVEPEAAAGEPATEAEAPKPILLWRQARFDQRPRHREDNRRNNRPRNGQAARGRGDAPADAGATGQPAASPGERPVREGRRDQRDGAGKPRFDRSKFKPKPQGEGGEPREGKPQGERAERRDNRPDWKGRPDNKGGPQGAKPVFQPKPREERPVRFDPDSPFAKLAALRDQLKK